VRCYGGQLRLKGTCVGTKITLMRLFVFGILILVSSGLADAQKSIRQVDFKNFIYPVSGTPLGHHRLQWLDTAMTHSNRKPIHLVNGEDLTESSSFVMDGQKYTQWEGFTLQSVEFADVTGSGQDEAIIVLHYRTGGTQQTDYVYIYSFADGKPNLLAYFHSGDRAYSGLYKVYGEKGKLVVELLEPKKKLGDCCSSGVVRMRYKWHDGRFEEFGTHESITLQ